MKKLLIFCLMLALVFPFAPAHAEADLDLNAVQPLLDITASAALDDTDKTEAIGENTSLSDRFVRAFVLAAIRNGFAAPSVAEDASAIETLLKSCFDAKLPEIKSVMVDASLPAYTGFQTLSVETDNGMIRLTGSIYRAADQMDRLTEDQLGQLTWLDGMFIVSLRRADDGYRVARFSAADRKADAPTENYMTDTLAEYVNPTLGFSIQYPAVFTEELLMETESGVSAVLKDNSASFRAGRTDNDKGLNIQQLIDAVKAAHPTAETEVQAADGAAKADYTENGRRTVLKLFAAGSAVYEAELSYSAEKSAEFDGFVNPMINSFNVDALGVG